MPTPYGIQLAQGAGAQGASNLVGSLFGLAFEKHNDRRQLRQQKKLSEQQMGFDKQMTDYQFQKQLQMWKDTNYGAQMAELKAAGLNPGLIYGMSGGGGTTTGSGGSGSVHAPAAPAGGGEIMGLSGQAMQAQLLGAQIKVMESQAKKNEADANYTSGAGTELAGAQIKDLLQGVENKKAQQVLTEIQSDLATIDQMFKTRTFDAAVKKLEYETNIALQEMEIIRNEGLISANTWSTKIEMIENEAAGIILRNAQTKTQTKLTQEQVNEVIQSIKTQVQNLENQGRSLDQKDKEILIEQERNRLINKGIEWGAGAQVLGKVIDVVSKKK